jgi:hypothetical protein
MWSFAEPHGFTPMSLGLRGLPVALDTLLTCHPLCPRSNGTTGLVLHNASSIQKPGTRYSYEDVTIIKGDIKAGAAVVYITDLP